MKYAWRGLPSKLHLLQCQIPSSPVCLTFKCFFHILQLLKPSIIASPGFIPMSGAARVLKEGLGCVLSSLGHVAHVEYRSSLEHPLLVSLPLAGLPAQGFPLLQVPPP